MAKRIQFDGAVHEFPDDFTDSDISSALGGPQQSPGQQTLAKLRATVAAYPKPAKDDRGVMESAYDTLPGAGGQWSDLVNGPKYAIQHPLDALSLIGNAASDAQQSTFQRGFERMNAGDKSGGALQVAEGMIPLVGPTLATSSNQAQTGNMPGAIGTAMGLGAQFAAATPEGQAAIGSGAAKLARLTETSPATRATNIAGAMKPTENLDTFAVAEKSTPALRQAAQDLGLKQTDFIAAGRGGMDKFGQVIKKAFDTQETKFNALFQPLKNTPISNQAAVNASQRTLNNAVALLDPEAAARVRSFSARLNGLNTLEDLNNARQYLNKELRSYYRKNTEGKFGSAMEVQAMENAANEMRDTLYGEIQSRTGQNVRPLKQTESNLFKMQTIYENSRRQISQAQAAHESSSVLERMRSGRGLYDSTVGAVVKPSPAAQFNTRIRRGLVKR